MKTRIDVNTLNLVINHSPASGRYFCVFRQATTVFFLREFRNGLREARAEIRTKVKNGQLRNSLDGKIILNFYMLRLTVYCGRSISSWKKYETLKICIHNLTSYSESY